MRPQIKHILRPQVLWLSLSAGLVYAAGSAPLAPETVPLAKWIYAVVLSTWGGLAQTLQRFAAGAETSAWPLLIARDVVCSVSAGVLVFMACLHFEIAPMLNAIAVFIAGYGGSRTLDVVFTKLESRIKGGAHD